MVLNRIHFFSPEPWCAGRPAYRDYYKIFKSLLLLIGSVTSNFRIIFLIPIPSSRFSGTLFLSHLLYRQIPRHPYPQRTLRRYCPFFHSSLYSISFPCTRWWSRLVFSRESPAPLPLSKPSCVPCLIWAGRVLDGIAWGSELRDGRPTANGAITCRTDPEQVSCQSPIQTPA